MTENKLGLPYFSDTVSPDWSPEQFDNWVESILTEDDRKIFGELAKNKVRDIILNLAVFAPEPATFAREHYEEVVPFDESTDQLLNPEETERAINIAEEMGILKEKDNKFLVDARAHRILETIFERY